MLLWFDHRLSLAEPTPPCFSIIILILILNAGAAILIISSSLCSYSSSSSSFFVFLHWGHEVIFCVISIWLCSYQIECTFFRTQIFHSPVHYSPIILDLISSSFDLLRNIWKGAEVSRSDKLVISKSKNLDSNQISNHLTFACPAVCKTSGILLFFWKIDVYNLQACSLWNSFALFCPFSSSVSYFDWSPPFSPTFCPWLLSTKAQRPLVFSPVRATRKAKQLQFCVPP